MHATSYSRDLRMLPTLALHYSPIKDHQYDDDRRRAGVCWLYQQRRQAGGSLMLMRFTNSVKQIQHHDVHVRVPAGTRQASWNLVISQVACNSKRAKKLTKKEQKEGGTDQGK
eukprot:scaffold24456_cov51-Attheya_sp.AAC.5